MRVTSAVGVLKTVSCSRMVPGPKSGATVPPSTLIGAAPRFREATSIGVSSGQAPDIAEALVTFGMMIGGAVETDVTTAGGVAAGVMTGGRFPAGDFTATVGVAATLGAGGFATPELAAGAFTTPELAAGAFAATDELAVGVGAIATPELSSVVR